MKTSKETKPTSPALATATEEKRSPCCQRNDALMKAAHWLNDFGIHAPITFGGESELMDSLQQALALPHCVDCPPQPSATDEQIARGLAANIILQWYKSGWESEELAQAILSAIQEAKR